MSAKGKQESRFDIDSVRKSVLITSHNIFRDSHVHIFFRTTFLEIAVYRVFGLVVAVTSTIVTSRYIFRFPSNSISTGCTIVFYS